MNEGIDKQDYWAVREESDLIRMLQILSSVLEKINRHERFMYVQFTFPVRLALN